MKFNLKDVNWAMVLVMVVVTIVVTAVLLHMTKFKSELTGETYKAQLLPGSKSKTDIEREISGDVANQLNAEVDAV